jgi:anti-sigma factor RsiW
MNCRRFQRDIYEYLDGSLSPRAQAAADGHLCTCAACRQALAQEHKTARSLANDFQRATDSLHLRPEVGRRVLAALGEQRVGADEEPHMLFFWRAWGLPSAVAALALLLLAGYFCFVRLPGPRRPYSQTHAAQRAVSIHLSYVVPIYTFRREGDFVIDSLTYQTNVMNGRLGADLARLP